MFTKGKKKVNHKFINLFFLMLCLYICFVSLNKSCIVFQNVRLKWTLQFAFWKRASYWKMHIKWLWNSIFMPFEKAGNDEEWNLIPVQTLKGIPLKVWSCVQPYKYFSCTKYKRFKTNQRRYGQWIKRPRGFKLLLECDLIISFSTHSLT